MRSILFIRVKITDFNRVFKANKTAFLLNIKLYIYKKSNAVASPNNRTQEVYSLQRCESSSHKCEIHLLNFPSQFVFVDIF